MQPLQQIPYHHLHPIGVRVRCSRSVAAPCIQVGRVAPPSLPQADGVGAPATNRTLHAISETCLETSKG